MDDGYADEYPCGVAVGGGLVVVIPVSSKRRSMLPNPFGAGSSTSYDTFRPVRFLPSPVILIFC